MKRFHCDFSLLIISRWLIKGEAVNVHHLEEKLHFHAKEPKLKVKYEQQECSETTAVNLEM